MDLDFLGLELELAVIVLLKGKAEKSKEEKATWAECGGVGLIELRGTSLEVIGYGYLQWLFHNLGARSPLIIFNGSSVYAIII